MQDQATKILQGHPLSPGLGSGRVVHLSTTPRETPRLRIRRSQIGSELRRFDTAVADAREEVERVRLRVRAELGPDEAEIFSAHRAMLDDPVFSERVRERVRRDLINVEQAVENEVVDLAARLSAETDAYLRERAIDVRDIGRRVLSSLLPHQPESIVPLSDQSVVVASELLPAETVDLDRAHVSAIVTEFGGETSHVAILARALGIPAVSGVEQATERLAGGRFVLVDGRSGRVDIDPSPEAVREFESRRSAYRVQAREALAREDGPCATEDGVRVSLQANIGRVEEAAAVAAHGLDGVGLFRTESLFLDSREPPAFERQVGIYRQVLAELGGRPLTVRTLDLGGDKLPTFLPLDLQRNPSLGRRGLRFSLSDPGLFDTQLRALVTAARDGPLRVLFPMAIDGEDLKAAIERLRSHERSVGSGGVEVGAMIETPAAVFAIDQIASQVDFLSIGTNDLAQFILAADRDAVDLLAGSSFEHPSVLRAVHRVVEAACAHSRPVSVCGEAAGDPRSACLLVGLGLRELSMSPIRAAGVRRALRGITAGKAAMVARKALSAPGPAGVTRCLSPLDLPAPEERV